MFYYQDQGNIRLGTPAVFQEMTGAEWAEETRIPPGADLSSYPAPTAADSELMRFLVPLYRAFKRKPPKLLIHEGRGIGQRTVHALETIPKGTVVAEYLGEWRPHHGTRSSYRWGPIDALHYRNTGGMLEDGFPNTAPFYLYHVDGVPLRVVFVAVEEISAGQVLATNYGMNHSVKLHYHEEYRKEALISFFSRHPLEKLEKRIGELRSRTPRDLGWRRTLELENLVLKLRYLFQTPGSFLHALAEGAIPAEKAFHYLAEPELRYFLLNFPFQPNFRQQEVIENLGWIQRYFEKGCPEMLSMVLLSSIRHRIFFRYYLKQVVEGEGPDAVGGEAVLWNRAFDAIQEGDQPKAELLFSQTAERESLIREGLLYAKELQSPLVSWLQSLADPPLPLSPTG